MQRSKCCSLFRALLLNLCSASRADIQTVLVEQGTITADYSEPPTCTICMGILQWDRDAPPSELVDVFLNKESGVAYVRLVAASAHCSRRSQIL